MAKGASGTNNFVDVEFGSAKVIDLRTDAEIEADTYDREITTVNTLIKASEAAEFAAYVYVVDGEIVFIAVEAEV